MQGRPQARQPARPQPRQGRGGGAQPISAAQALRGGPYQAASPELAQSPIMRGQRSALSRREALILLSLLNHPFLLHDHLEDIAALELAHPDAHRLRAGIIAAFAHDHHHATDETKESAKLRTDLDKAGLGPLVERMERGVTTRNVWGVEPGAAREDVLSTWRQLVALHRQMHSLTRELRDAELALGSEPSEAHEAWLRDVKARLAEVDGTEALIEGFGELSGRSIRGE
jgi:DNA primase